MCARGGRDAAVNRAMPLIFAVPAPLAPGEHRRRAHRYNFLGCCAAPGLRPPYVLYRRPWPLRLFSLTPPSRPFPALFTATVLLGVTPLFSRRPGACSRSSVAVSLARQPWPPKPSLVPSVGGQAAVAATAVDHPCLREAVVKVRVGIVRARELLLAKAPLAWLMPTLFWKLNQAACVSLMTLTTRWSPSFWALHPPQLLRISVV